MKQKILVILKSSWWKWFQQWTWWEQWWNWPVYTKKITKGEIMVKEPFWAKRSKLLFRYIGKFSPRIFMTCIFFRHLSSLSTNMTSFWPNIPGRFLISLNQRSVLYKYAKQNLIFDRLFMRDLTYCNRWLIYFPFGMS